jgi:HD superfamily phosphodiesterase
MENRIEVLRKHIDETILNMTDYEERRCAYVHLYGVSQFCALIALKRNQNAELATMAGMLHDFYTYKMMDMVDHDKKGAILAKETLDLLGITSEKETELICNAISVHCDKKNTHSDFAEILIDADVMQHNLYNISFPIADHENERMKKLKNEFGLSW